MPTPKSLLAELATPSWQPTLASIESQMSSIVEQAQQIEKQHQHRILDAARKIGSFANIKSVIQDAQRGTAAAELLDTQLSTASKLLNEPSSLIRNSFKQFNPPNELLNISTKNLSSTLASIDHSYRGADVLSEALSSARKHCEKLSSNQPNVAEEILSMNDFSSATLSEFTTGFKSYFAEIHEQVKSAISGIESANTLAQSSINVAREINEKAIKEARKVTEYVNKRVHQTLDETGIDIDLLMLDCVNNPDFQSYYDDLTKSNEKDESLIVDQLIEINAQLAEQNTKIEEQNLSAKEQEARNRKLAIGILLFTIASDIIIPTVRDVINTPSVEKAPEFAQMKQDMVMYSSCSMNLETVGKINEGDTYLIHEQHESCFKISFVTELGTTITGYVNPYRMKH